MRYVCLFAVLLLSPKAFSQENWDWQVLDTGCYILDPNGEPTKYCLQLWQQGANAIHGPQCAGPCSDGVACDQAPNMFGEEGGPDLHAETPAVMPPTDPVNEPGNQTRKRWLKCVRFDDCICVLQGSGVFFCKKILNTDRYSSGGTFQGDLNGPACEPDQQQPPQ